MNLKMKKIEVKNILTKRTGHAEIQEKDRETGRQERRDRNRRENRKKNRYMLERARLGNRNRT